MHPKKYGLLLSVFLVLACLVTGCASDSQNSASTTATDALSESASSQTASNESKSENGGDLHMEQFTMENGKTVYLYVPQTVKDNPNKKVPLVLFMCGTTCDPVDDAVNSGWLTMAEKENLIVVSPDYNNYATYSEVDFLISVVDHMLQNYPVDRERVYSTGFSNGGAASVALTREYPQYFAAISAMGWMIGMDNKNGIFEQYDMPFQVIQGDGEFTVKTPSGAMAVMDDEKDGIRSMMLYNEMIQPDQQTDYEKMPYWGYEPNEKETRSLNGRKWEICSYHKDGYSAPFAQFVLVEDEKHRPRPEEAEIAWDFFKRFKRDTDGRIIELNS